MGEHGRCSLFHGSGTKEVAQWAQLTHSAGKALDDIVDMVRQVGQKINEIAIAAAEQSATTDEDSEKYGLGFQTHHGTRSRIRTIGGISQ